VNDQHSLTPTRQLEFGTVTGPLVVAIERTWAAIQERHPDVPDVVLTLGNGSARPGQLTPGHFTTANGPPATLGYRSCSSEEKDWPAARTPCSAPCCTKPPTASPPPAASVG